MHVCQDTLKLQFLILILAKVALISVLNVILKDKNVLNA